MQVTVPQKLPLASELRTELLGKSKQQVQQRLGRPSDTFSQGWKYFNCVTNNDTGKPDAIWFWFDDAGIAVKIE